MTVLVEVTITESVVSGGDTVVTGVSVTKTVRVDVMVSISDVVDIHPLGEGDAICVKQCCLLNALFAKTCCCRPNRAANTKDLVNMVGRFIQPNKHRKRMDRCYEGKRMYESEMTKVCYANELMFREHNYIHV